MKLKRFAGPYRTAISLRTAVLEILLFRVRTPQKLKVIRYGNTATTGMSTTRRQVFPFFNEQCAMEVFRVFTHYPFCIVHYALTRVNV
jgi:hypothetical protein